MSDQPSILGQLTRHTLTSLGSIILCFTILWAFVQPHAEQFVRATMQRERFASADTTNALNLKVSNLDGQLKALMEAVGNQANAQYRVETDLGFIKEMQREQREDIKLLLKREGQR